MEGQWSTIWLITVIVLAVIWLVLVIINLSLRLSNKRTNLSASMVAMFLGNMIVYLLMFGTCFLLFDDSPGWPHAAFWILIVLYVIAESVSALYFIAPDWASFTDVMTWFHNKVGTNPFKGWGGETFADLSNGFGILVAVGINLVFPANNGSYWWAGQIAAIMSVMSAAAWAQRYSFEYPKEYRSGWGEYVPKSLDTPTAMLIVLAVLVPIKDNNLGRLAAKITDVSATIWPWLIVFLIWFIVALIAWIRSRNGGSLPRWPKGAIAGVSSASSSAIQTAGNRGKISRFLLWMWISCAAIVIILFVLVLVWSKLPIQKDGSGGVEDRIGGVIGLFTAIIFVVSQAWSVGKAYLENRKNPRAAASAGEAFKFWKSIVFLLIGFIFILAQVLVIKEATERWLGNDGVRITYIVILSIFGLFCFIGVLADTYRMIPKWEEAERQRLASA